MNKKNLKEFSVLFVIFYFVNTNNAFAYIDPGSASAVITAILGFFAAAGFTIRKYLYKIKSFFIKDKKRDNLEDRFNKKP